MSRKPYRHLRHSGSRPFDIQKLILRKTAEASRLETHVVAPPYCPWSAAEWLKVAVEERTLTGIDGYVEVQDENALRIVLSKNAPIERKRFTLAHELGHVILIRECVKKGPVGSLGTLKRFRSRTVPRDFIHDPEEEHLCNYFAAEFLMPESDVCSLLGRKRLRPEMLFMMREAFHVSFWAAARRIRDVNRQNFGGVSLWTRKPWLVPMWTVGWCGTELHQILDVALAKGHRVCYAGDSVNNRSLEISILPLPKRGMVLTVAAETTPVSEESTSHLLPILDTRQLAFSF